MSERPEAKKNADSALLTPPVLGTRIMPIGCLMVADAASKTSGLHKLLHCVGTLERARWEHARINRFFPRHILWGAHRHYCFHRVESAVWPAPGLDDTRLS